MRIMDKLEARIDGWKGFPVEPDMPLADSKEPEGGAPPDRARRMRAHLEARLLANLLDTYHRQRRWMGWIAIAFPFVLLALGCFAFGAAWQPSISDYYYALPSSVELPDCSVDPARCASFLLDPRTGNFPLRPFFCGGLIAVGVYLCVYAGISWLEEWALNFAGLFAIGVAVFPMEKQLFGSSYPNWAHFACAAGLFVCMWFISRFCAKDTLEFVTDEKTKDRYVREYRRIALAMACVLALGGLYGVAKSWFDSAFPWSLFCIETLGIVIFGAFWVIKSKEIASHEFGAARRPKPPHGV